MKIAETVRAHCAWLEQLRRRGVIEKTDELRLKMDAWEEAALGYARFPQAPAGTTFEDWDATAALTLARNFLRLRTLLDPGEARDASGVSEAGAGQ